MKKKSSILISAFVIMLLASCGCGKKQKTADAYTTFENDVLMLEYPKTWETEIAPYPFRPFAAASVGGSQFVAIGTRLIDGVSIDSFAADRIRNFEENQWGFKLISKEINNDEAKIRYVNEDETRHIGTYMRIIRHGELFYGIDCSYETEAEKDTVERIVNSLRFK